MILNIRIMKKSLSILFLGLCMNLTMAQTNEQKPLGGYWKIQSGISQQNYQSLKAAKHQLNGTGINFGIGRNIEKEKSITGINFGFDNSNLTSSLSKYVEVKSKTFKIDFEYLQKIKTTNINLYLGAGLNSNFNIFENSRLTNDESTYNFLNTLMLKAALRKNLKIKSRTLQAEFKMGLGLLAYGKDTKSFAFTAPQAFLEDGKFNYQGATDDADNPFKEHQLMSIGKYRRIQTGLKLSLLPKANKKNYWEIGYKWNYYSYEDVKNYRVTSGTHNLSIAYNFTFRKK